MAINASKSWSRWPFSGLTSGNYTIGYVAGQLSVNKAALTVTADAQSRLYGNASPALSYAVTGLVGGDLLSGGLATTADAASNVGSYAIRQGTLVTTNYVLTYQGANLTVTARPLTVTADAQSRAAGDPNPWVRPGPAARPKRKSCVA